MKKYYFLLLAAFCIATSSKAAPGDTTWVQANNVELTYYNNYDTTINFPAPGTTYRKIYMIFTLGKYMCPGYNPANPGTGAGQTGWCGDWDYTVQNYLMTPSGDTIEIGRQITPYANALAPRTPWAATQIYTYDVTDYTPLLQDSATMRIHYSGYSGGFTANIMFAFIEGTPDRNVLGVQKLWDGSFTYGDTVGGDVNDINTHFTNISETAPVGTQTTSLKFTVTGHGGDSATDCCEFDPHNYQVMVNNTSIATQTIWRDNCGSNWLYPQSGTWLYNRGNWCPGDMVFPRYNVLPVTTGTPFNIGIKFDSYIEPPTTSVYSYGLYTVFGALVYYGGINKPLDASLDQIIAPTTNQIFFRENPLLGNPTIRVKNTGATTIDSISFQYGVQDSAMQTYIWVGTLNSLQDTVISLPLLTALNNIAGTSGTFTFIAKIVTVNGATDDDATNNTMTSPFVSAPIWPSELKIKFKTNNDYNSNPEISPTSWVIYDKNNDIVAERIGVSINTLFTDTVNLPIGCYKLQVTDTNCDGLAWWVFPDYGLTDGYINVDKLPNTLLPFNGNFLSSSYPNDFGCGFVQYFYVDSISSTAIRNVTQNNVAIDAFPNPAQNIVNVEISGMPNVSGKIEIIDMLGRVVSVTPTNSANQQINVSQLISGVYTILFVNSTNSNKLETRLLITK